MNWYIHFVHGLQSTSKICEKFGWTNALMKVFT